MSAGTHAYVACDYLDRNAAPGHKFCHERIEEGRTAAQARKVARSRGWLTGVRSDGSSPRKGSAFLGSFDFCLAHKPAPKEGPAEKRPAGREALRSELARLATENQEWQQTARACVCTPAQCTRAEFRDHQGDSPGCMVCADLDPGQPCYAAVIARLEAGG